MWLDATSDLTDRAPVTFAHEIDGAAPARGGFGFGARELRRCGAAHQTYRSLCAGLGLGDENGTAGAERPSLVHNPIIGAAPAPMLAACPGGAARG